MLFIRWYTEVINEMIILTIRLRVKLFTYYAAEISQISDYGDFYPSSTRFVVSHRDFQTYYL